MSESIFKLEFEAAAIDVERLKNFKHFFYRRDSTQIDLILGPADHIKILFALDQLVENRSQELGVSKLTRE